jgi:replicative DNA helicase
VHEAKKPIDLLTVSKQINTLENTDGTFLINYVTALTNRVCSTANLEYHALILIELYLKDELKKLAFIYKRGLIMQNAEMAEVMGELHQALLDPTADPLEILFGTITYLRINFPTESELYQSILDLDNEFNATALKVRKQLGSQEPQPITEKHAVMNNEPEHWPEVKTKAKEIAKEAERKMQLEVQESLYFDLNA